ncbi:MAG: type II secretion system F family protein [Eubacterium sp.]|jgi:Type II secretory pathway, component PulF|nr:type II secretion system F family protein [Eubacterium sp.]
MARYKYVITDKYGKEKKGMLESQSEEQAIARLKGDGSVVLQIKETKSLDDAAWNIQIGSGVKKKDITIFCKQFHSILTAGVTVIDGLQMVQDQTENKNLRRALLNVQANVSKGESLAGAMEQEGKVFPELLIHMVRAGEATGNLEIAFERITSQFDKDMKLVSMVRSAMIYPIVVVIVAVAVVIILMSTVIPNFRETFETMGEELPGLTKMVIALSDFITGHLVGVLGTIVGLVIFIIVGKGTEPGKQFLSRVALIIPMIKNFSVKNASARFSMTMATLVMSGVPLVDALEIAGDVISNRLIRKAVKDCREEVMQGIPMSEPLEASGVFPPMLTHMLRIGEETGTTEQMLDKVAEYYEEEVTEATRNLTTAMEPMIIIVLAVLVGGILGAVMMPMLSIYENAGNA